MREPDDGARGADAIVDLVARARAAGRRVSTSALDPADAADDVVAIDPREDAGVLSLDVRGRRAWAAPGTTLGELRTAVRPYGLTYYPRTTAPAATTLDEILADGTCAGDVRHVAPESAPVAEIDLLTYRGARMTVGPTPARTLEERQRGETAEADVYRRLAGFRATYDREIDEHMPRATLGLVPSFRALLDKNGDDVATSLIGSGGALAIPLRFHCRLEPLPKHRSVVALGFPDPFVAADNAAFVDVYAPEACDAIDRRLVDGRRWRSPLERYFRKLPDGGAQLLVLFEGDDRLTVDQRAQSLLDAYRTRDIVPPYAIERTSDDADFASDECATGAWYDMACPLEMLGHFLRDFKAIADQRGYPVDLGGHFGRGVVHARVGFPKGLAVGSHERLGFDRAVATSVARFKGTTAGRDPAEASRRVLGDILFGTRIVNATKDYAELWDPDGMLLRRPKPMLAEPPEDPRLAPTPPRPARPKTTRMRAVREALVAVAILALATLLRDR